MITAAAYAKINLYLAVTGDLPSGYHSLESVMHTLTLYDTVKVTDSDHLSLSCCWTDPVQQGAVFSSRIPVDSVTEAAEFVPCDSRNLAWKAAEALRNYAGIRRGAHIHLIKAIPAAAGLAGGSADAAATLVALNELWGAGLSPSELAQLGAGLGADIPFCLSGGSKLCVGRGDEMTDAPLAPDWSVLLVKPDFSLSTQSVYQALDAYPDAWDSPNGTANILRAIRTGDIGKVGISLYNKLETASFGLAPSLGEWMALIKATGTAGTLMSGSGPTIFSLFANPQAAQAAASVLVNATRDLGGAQVIVTRLGASGAALL